MDILPLEAPCEFEQSNGTEVIELIEELTVISQVLFQLKVDEIEGHFCLLSMSCDSIRSADETRDEAGAQAACQPSLRSIFMLGCARVGPGMKGV